MTTEEEQRERAIQNIADMLRTKPFTFEFVVKDKPKGIKVFYEVTQGEMDAMLSEMDAMLSEMDAMLEKED